MSLIFFCSRNNYQVLEKWLERNEVPDGTVLLNLDVESTEEQIEYGSALCEKYGVHFRIAPHPAIQRCFEYAVEFAREQSIDWVIYSQQDTYTMTPNFFELLERKLDSIGYRPEIGFIGVNIYHDDADISQRGLGSRWMTSARTFLQLGDGWYRRKLGCRCDYSNFENKDFLAESIFVQ